MKNTGSNFDAHVCVGNRLLKYLFLFFKNDGHGRKFGGHINKKVTSTSDPGWEATWVQPVSVHRE